MHGSHLQKGTKILVELDERSHARVFPRPPMADLIDRIPHDWLTTFDDLEQWDVFVEGVCDPKLRRCTYRPLFHDTHIELTWTSVEEGRLSLVPPQPLRLPDRWNAVTLWIGGVPDGYQGPAMDCTLHFQNSGGGCRQVEICTKDVPRRAHGVDLFHRLVPGPLRHDIQAGLLTAIEIGIRPPPGERRGGGLRRRHRYVCTRSPSMCTRPPGTIGGRHNCLSPRIRMESCLRPNTRVLCASSNTRWKRTLMRRSSPTVAWTVRK